MAYVPTLIPVARVNAPVSVSVPTSEPAVIEEANAAGSTEPYTFVCPAVAVTVICLAVIAAVAVAEGDDRT